MLQTVTWRLVGGFSLRDRNHEVAGVSQEVVSALLGSATSLIADKDYATIREGLLLCKGVRIIVPSRCDEFGQDVLATGVGFSDH